MNDTNTDRLYYSTAKCQLQKMTMAMAVFTPAWRKPLHLHQEVSNTNFATLILNVSSRFFV